MLEELVDRLQSDKELLKNFKARKSLEFSLNGKAAEELTQADVNAIFHEALKIIADRLQREKDFRANKSAKSE